MHAQRSRSWWIVDTVANDAAIERAASLIPGLLEAEGFGPDDPQPFEAFHQARDWQEHDAPKAAAWSRVRAAVFDALNADCDPLNSPYATEAEIVHQS